MNNCAKLFWNPCINVEVIALTSSIYDHFIIWPSTINLTFNLPEQMFQMNNCARLFSNPCINVDVISQTSPIYDHFIIWPSSVILIFNLPKQMFQMKHDLQVWPWPWTYLKNASNGTAIPQGEQLCHIFLKSMHKCRSYGPDKLNIWPFDHFIFKSDLDLQPSWLNVPNGTSTHQGEQLPNYFESHS